MYIFSSRRVYAQPFRLPGATDANHPRRTGSAAVGMCVRRGPLSLLEDSYSTWVETSASGFRCRQANTAQTTATANDTPANSPGE